ncbi:MAG: S8 family serine peptidase [Myxococcota bacterium]
MIALILAATLSQLSGAPKQRWIVGLPGDPMDARVLTHQLERFDVAGRLPFAWAIDVSPEELGQLESLKVRYLEMDRVFVVQKRQSVDCTSVQWTLRPLDGFPTSLQIDDAWAINTGFVQGVDANRVTVAVVDDGIEGAHPELNGRIEGATNLSGDGLEPGELDARDEHGTQTAGVIAAARDSVGMSGVCPDCALLSVRLLGDGGPGDLYEVSSFAAANAISWAVDNGADVINNSWGPPDGNPFAPNAPRESYPLPRALDDALNYAVTEGRDGLGAVVVWSAGNGGEPIGYDAFARDPRVITVGSVDFSGRRAVYSDWGLALDLVTPSSGSDGDPAVLTADRLGPLGGSAKNETACAVADPCDEVCLEDYTRDFGGTSASAAHVSGIAALLIAEYPTLTAAQVIEALLESARPMDSLGPRSSRYGFGQVDALGAFVLAGEATGTQTRSFDLCGNGFDDDGDGSVDEDCDGCVASGPELCDGIDNDCDGYIDPGFTCASGDRGLCGECESSGACAEGFRCRPSDRGPGTFCLPRCDAGASCPEGTVCGDGDVCDLTPDGPYEDCYAYAVSQEPVGRFGGEGTEAPESEDQGCAAVFESLFVFARRRARGRRGRENFRG